MGQIEPEYFSRQVLSAKRFFRNQLKGFEGPRVVGGGREFCSEDFLIERESFPYVILEFVSAGRGLFEMNGRKYKLEPGTVMYYGPEHSHKISALKGHELHKYFLTVIPYKGIPAPELYGSVFHTSDPMSIYASFEELIKYGENPSPRADDLCSTCFKMLMGKCSLHFVEYGVQFDSAFHNYLRCKNLIAEQYMELKSTKDAAALCAVTEAYLCKLFAHYDHHSPYNFLMNLRMTAAAGMIADANRSVKDVAASFGYSDQGHFSRAFKRILGSSPSSFKV